MIEHSLSVASEKDFDEVYKIMHASFPPCEIGSYERQKSLLSHPNYKLYIKKEANTIVAFFGAWEFEDFIFGEHFAVDERCRGNGLGASILKEILETSDKLFFIEVESPDTELAKRRIHFYERLGFIYSEYGYTQPSLQEGSQSVELVCMSYPIGLTKSKFEQCKNTLFTYVYKKLD